MKIKFTNGAECFARVFRVWNGKTRIEVKGRSYLYANHVIANINELLKQQ